MGYYTNLLNKLKKDHKKELKEKKKKELEKKRNSETFLTDLFEEAKAAKLTQEEINNINHHNVLNKHIQNIRKINIPTTKKYQEELQNQLGNDVKIVLCDSCQGSKIIVHSNKDGLFTFIEKCKSCVKGVHVMDIEDYEKERDFMNMTRNNLDIKEKSDNIETKEISEETRRVLNSWD